MTRRGSLSQHQRGIKARSCKRHATMALAGIAALISAGCAGGSMPHQSPALKTNGSSENSRSGVVAPQAVTMKLSDGETVTIQPGSEPPIYTPDQIPAAILTAVRNHQDLSMGAFHAVKETDDISWTTHVPAPSGGNGLGPTRSVSEAWHTESSTGSNADHSTDGWYVNGYDSNSSYQTEGYVQFNADMGLPTLYPEQAGASGNYVYYAPTTQGTNGNPLEVGLATEPDWPYAGPQHLFIYDWAASNGNTPCDQQGYPNCVGFTSYSPTVNSTFTSKYVRVLSHGVPEWSMETVQSNGWWYFGIYNHGSGQWEYPYSEPYTEIRHNFSTGLNGYGGGHGYFEYYLPANTACAGADPSNPSTANTYETDAQQYSATSKTWTRISNEKYMYPGLTGYGVCFSGPNSPYFSFGDFGDGWSDWKATWE